MSSLEEYLGIIATNLALSRTMYLFCRDGPRVPTKNRVHRFRPLFFSTRHASAPNPSKHPEGLFTLRTKVDRGVMDQWSITKTTELDITEEPRTVSSEGLTGTVYKEDWV